MSLKRFVKKILSYFHKDCSNPVGNYMFKVNNKNAKARCEIFSKLTIKTSKRRDWRRSGFFNVNFENILHLVLVFLLLI